MLLLPVVGLVVAGVLAEAFVVAPPKIYAFKPRGFQVSIYDEPGIELFAFHGSINEHVPPLATGRYSRDVFKKRNGMWTYYDHNVRLFKGDTINFWLYVMKDGQGHRLDDQKFIVQELVDKRCLKSGNCPVSAIPFSNSTKQLNTALYNIYHDPTNNPSAENVKKCEAKLVEVFGLLKDSRNSFVELNETLETLRELLKRKSDTHVHSLHMQGRIPKSGDAIQTVLFMLSSRMRIMNPEHLISAVRNPDGSITFEVDSFEEKLKILLEAVKKERSAEVYISEATKAEQCET